MSYDDSMFWRARAEQMRALAETMEAGISKQVMRRIAEDYERFAESIEQRPNRFLPPEEVVPAEVRKFGHRTRSAGAPPPLVPDYDLPDFLKRAHATAEEPSDDNGS